MNSKERDRLQRLLRQKKLFQQEAEIYQTLMDAMREGLPQADVYKLILSSITKGLRFDRAGIFLLQPDGKHVSRVIGIDARGRIETGPKVFEIEDVPNSSVFSDLIFRHKEYFLSNRLENRRNRGKDKGKFGTTNRQVLNHAVVPLKVGQDRIIGVLAVDNMFSRRFISKTDLSGLMTFATQVGMVVQSFHLHERILSLTVTDQLTGLHNRRYFDEFIEREIARCIRYRRPCGLFYIDIDRFKGINDRFGHLVGDLVLKQVASVLKSCLRTIDQVCRIGGEEFAVILPETGPSHYPEMAERLRRAVRETESVSAEVRQAGHAVTISIGCAFYESGPVTVDDLMRLADESLYEAKTSGRDRLGGVRLLRQG